uniref:Uncharacterized protein n=1 Tax=Solanum lycopersicum TaxID=4081 RepID=A0A3Q7HBW0_SOLLC
MRHQQLGGASTGSVWSLFARLYPIGYISSSSKQSSCIDDLILERCMSSFGCWAGGNHLCST